MIKASYPLDEQFRLQALAEYNDLSLDDLPSLDHIVTLASKLFDVPMAFVSLVREDTQFFHAKIGMDVACTPRDISFCSHTVLKNELMVILDAAYDHRFHDNPLTLQGPRIRFYAGMPLRSPSGYPIGTLCLADHSPRNKFSERDISTLHELARIAMDALEMHRLEIARRVGQRRFEGIANNSPDSILCTDQNGVITFWNPAAEALYGYGQAEIIGKNIEYLLPPQYRGLHAINLAKVAHGQSPKQAGKTIELETVSAREEVILTELSLSMWFENGQVAFGAILRDIRERRYAEETLFRMAHTDTLTGLPNRAMLKSRLEESVSQGRPVMLLLIDLDNFKEVNDTSGHPAGDEILKHAASRLLACVRDTDLVSRLGGDEFAVLIHSVREDYMADERADLVIEALQRPFSHDGQVFHLGGSVGMALFPSDAATTDELISNADMALYQAKVDGKNRWHRFSPSLRQKSMEARTMRLELSVAAEEGQFEVYFQPQVLLRDGTVTGAEALIRWNHPTQGVLPPEHFLATLENSRHAETVAYWVLRTACAQAVEWRKVVPSFRVAVNLFSKQLESSRLVTLICRILESCGLPPEGLELEVTENICLHENRQIIENLKQLYDMGIGVAFDDYGTGFASLSVLKNFPLTKIKIDRSFVASMATSRTDAVIAKSIIQLGKGLGYAVIAEGIESASEAQQLMDKGCTEGQGYFFGHPATAAAFSRDYLAQR